MFNAHKSFLAVAAAAALMAAVSSCGDNKARTEAAQNLVEQARALVAAHNCDSAISVLDTLDRSYRDCLEQRREGTTVRLTALASLSRDSLASAELQLREATTALDALKPQFKNVQMKGTQGFYVYAPAYTGREMNTTCIQPRVDDGGYMFIVANIAGRGIGLNSLEYNGVSTAKGEAVTVEGSEIMSLMQEGTGDFVNALCNATAPATVTLQGSKGKTTVKLDAKALEAMRATRDFAQALQRERRLNITLEKLERQLARLNDQIANQIPVEPQAEEE